MYYFDSLIGISQIGFLFFYMVLEPMFIQPPTSVPHPYTVRTASVPPVCIASVCCPYTFGLSVLSLASARFDYFSVWFCIVVLFYLVWWLLIYFIYFFIMNGRKDDSLQSISVLFEQFQKFLATQPQVMFGSSHIGLFYRSLILELLIICHLIYHPLFFYLPIPLCQLWLLMVLLCH